MMCFYFVFINSPVDLYEISAVECPVVQPFLPLFQNVSQLFSWQIRRTEPVVFTAVADDSFYNNLCIKRQWIVFFMSSLRRIVMSE